MSKKLLGIIIFLLLMIGMMSLVGCSNTDVKTTNEYNVILYFANDEYVQTGDESFEHMIVVKDFKLESEEGQQYMDLVNTALRTVPEGLENADTLIDDKIVFNEVSVEGGVVTVDLARASMSGGSLQESFVISQIVESLLGSFEEINSVQFLVDGEIAESLMGHYDVSKPFTEGISN
jgi:germination protein M